jgi:hypothetical protein
MQREQDVNWCLLLRPLLLHPLPLHPLLLPLLLPGEGYDEVSKKCVECEVGTSNFLNRYCKPCMVGTCNPFRGMAFCEICLNDCVVTQDRTDCVPCEPSFYKQDYIRGSYPYVDAKPAVCMKCPAGTWSGLYGPTDKCRKCRAGSVVNSDQTGCEKVTSTIAPTSDPTAAVTDPTYIPTPAPSPMPTIACAKGEYIDLKNALLCKDCEASFFCIRGRRQKCPYKAYSFAKATFCRECPEGTKINGLQTGSVIILTSKPTYRPSINPQYTAPPTDAPTSSCVSGQNLNPNTGKCQDCDPGYFSTFVGMPCQLCMAGSYTEYPGSTQCYKCFAGQQVVLYKYCYNCEAGGYAETPRAINYTPNDIETCKKCPFNQYSYPMAAKCMDCQPGSVPTLDQSGCELSSSILPTASPTSQDPPDVPTPCGPGQASNNGVCYSCNPGFYSTNGQTTQCKQCPVGMIDIEERSSCSFCPIGYGFSDNYCGMCSPGYYAPLPDSQSGSPLGDGPPRLGCTKCPPGMYSKYADYRCHPCPNGTEVNLSEDGCDPCPVNTFSFRGITSKCKQCPEGTYSGEKAAKCLSV